MSTPKRPVSGEPFEVIQVKLTHNLDGTLTIDPGEKGFTSDPFSLLMNLKNLQRILEDHFPKEIHAGYMLMREMVIAIQKEESPQTPGTPAEPAEPIDLSRFVGKKGIN